jgi:hypothetical protein
MRPFVRHKFGAKRTEANGRTYDSKAEARYAERLELRKRAGDVLFYLEQVPVRLPGKTKYVVDFVVFEASGDVRFIDVKGMETQVFKLKKRQVEELYPFEIEVVS